MATRKLNKEEKDILMWAITQAAAWKGGVDPEDFDWYDNMIEECHRILKKLRVEE